MPRLLTTHEATVQTVQIEIHALKVGPKQVTMGLFRQLIRDALLDPETLQLRGVPWGHVNYWWDGDGDVRAPSTHPGAKRHVVWQRGQELRRDIVYEKPEPFRMGTYTKSYRRLYDDWVVLQVPLCSTLTVLPSTVQYIPERSFEVRVNDLPYRVTLSDKELDTLRWYANHREDDAGYRALLAARNLEGATILDVRTAMTTTNAEKREYAAEWAKQWQVLRDLPQLFIAV